MIIEIINRKAKKLFYQLLLFRRIRYYYCRIRFAFLKRNIKFLDTTNKDIGDKTILHNINGLMNEKASFGMGGRMGLLLYPVNLLLRELENPKILIVGPRTEDDIYFAKAMGLEDTTGLDLFTYSKYIDIGDIHSTDYPDKFFDAVLLGWMISYTSNPEEVINECTRILKPGGLLGIGIESNYEYKTTGHIPFDSPRVNNLNTANDLINLANMKPLFIHDPDLMKSYDCAVVLKK